MCPRAVLYDAAGRVATIDDSDANAIDFAFSYDQRGQLTYEQQITGLLGQNIFFGRSYDAVGNRTGLEANLGGSLVDSAITGGIWDFQNVYGYDDMDRLTSIVSGSRIGGNAVSQKLASFSYDAASQLTDLRRYSAATVNSGQLEVHSRYDYDDAGRLTSLTHASSNIAAGESWDGTSSIPNSLPNGALLAAYSLAYDQGNRITSFASFKDAFVSTNVYDDRDQLTSVTYAAISGLTLPFALPTLEGYDLDAGGNRRSDTGASQSASGTHNRLQTDGTYNYEYDGEGNTTKRTSIATGAETEYNWDHRNRLELVVQRASAGGAPTQIIGYDYDALDQRIGKRVDQDADGAWDRSESFVWAEGQEVLRFEDRDGQGTSQAFRLASRYLYGDAVDQLLADEQYGSGSGPLVGAGTASTQVGNTLWALSDHLGSIRDVVDSNGVIRQHVVYDSFGNRTLEVDYDTAGNMIANNHAAAIDELFGYAGRDWDADTQLQYNRARWYDPTTGRWLSQDPIGFAGGDVNLYRYVGNGPTNKTDPSGLAERITVNGVPWAGRGQHVIPGAVARDKLSFLGTAQLERLRDFRIAAGGDGLHNYTAHGKYGYSGAADSLVQAFEVDFRSRYGLGAGSIPSNLHDAFADELMKAFNGQPQGTVICDFNEAVRTKGKAGQREIREILKTNGLPKWQLGNRRGLVLLPLPDSPPRFPRISAGAIGAVGAGLVEEAAAIYAIDDILGTPMYFWSQSAYESSVLARQDYYIGMYFNGTSNGLAPRIIENRGRAFIHSQMERARMNGTLTLQQEIEYSQASGINDIIPLWFEMRCER